MNCCINCFKDFEIKSIIKNNSTEMGDCNFCNTKSTQVIDTRELVELFHPLINIYTLKKTSKSNLAEKIQSDWDIFNINNIKINSLLLDMFSGESKVNKEIFNKPVINKGELSEESLSLLNQWDLLKDEIKYKNRYFIQNILEFELLEELLLDQTHSYSKGKIFYRARISTEKGLSKVDLGKPSANSSSAGRANPKGIPYLYLSTEAQTTLYETRAIYLDFVTIGEFKLIDNLKVVRLRSIGEKSPFRIQNLDKYIRYQKFILELEKELSKPLRRYDSELDYLPTQYLCEFIKSRGYDGVEYSSAIKKGGINLAIFNDSKFECIGSKIVEIKNIEISY